MSWTLIFIAIVGTSGPQLPTYFTVDFADKPHCEQAVATISQMWAGHGVCLEKGQK